MPREARQMRKTARWVAILALVGCAGPTDADGGLFSLCRPEGVAPGHLRIGDMQAHPETMEVRLDARGEGGWYGITIRLDPTAADRLAQVTRENIGQPLVLAIDGEIIAEPVVQTPILDGRVLISGNFTRHEAGAIVERLSPACPVDREDGRDRPDTESEPGPAGDEASGPQD
ncbi:MAG: hypothetical protein GVY06_01590 [Alphaproteobacteria bacterium]|nr:hypothetical protein [Alphaproteobacteria bacterium]